MARLARVRAALAAGDGDAVAAWNDGAQEERRRLRAAELAVSAVCELRVSVPNRPGVVAQLALALGQAGVNIVDMALAPAADNASGTISLWLDGRAQRRGGGATPGRPGLRGGAGMNATFRPGTPLRGTLTAPPDKSISHRAALLGAMSATPVHVTGYLDAADTRSTLAAVAALGARVEERGRPASCDRRARPRGAAPGADIDVGNAGTLLRLLPGWLAGQPAGRWTLDGDASIRRRPVDRIARPLAAMGADLRAREDRFTPLAITARPLSGIEYALPVASAQIKSCVLLAGLLAEGTDGRRRARAEPRPHGAACWPRAGVPVRRGGRPRRASGHRGAGARRDPRPRRPLLRRLPRRRGGARARARASWSRGWRRTGRGSASSASWSAWARPSRAPWRSAPRRRPTPSRCARSRSRTGRCAPPPWTPEEVPLAIDELPLVALLGCFAEGETVVRGAQELRLKESDRIATVVDGLRGLGADIEATADGFAVRGTGGLRGGALDAHGDHRLAMLGAVAGLASRDGVEVIGMEAAAVSYPGFERDLAALLS